jgi:hypothetical protein
LPVTLTTLPGHHHFSILDQLARPDGTLTDALVNLIKTVGSRDPEIQDRLDRRSIFRIAG